MFLLMLATITSQAQKVHVYGHTTSGTKPLPGVLIMIFEKDRFYKKIVSSKKGEFQFFIGGWDYFILFYRPGMRPEAYHIINNAQEGLMMIPINMEMQAAERDPDSVLVHAPLLSYSNPEIVKAYLPAVYDYASPHRDTASTRTRSTLMRKAIEERERFSHYRTTTVHSSTQDSAERTTIVIGPDSPSTW